VNGVVILTVMQDGAPTEIQCKSVDDALNKAAHFYDECEGDPVEIVCNGLEVMGKPLLHAYLESDRTNRPKTLFERLTEHLVYDGECWLWCGDISGNHGVIRVDGKTMRVHRVSWELYHREYVPNGLHVLHTCKQTLCVNPEHLYLSYHRTER
jgi:hypothetical protein